LLYSVCEGAKHVRVWLPMISFDKTRQREGRVAVTKTKTKKRKVTKLKNRRTSHHMEIGPVW